MNGAAAAGHDPQRSSRVDFGRINRVALANAAAVLSALLPGGRREGSEWVSLNPMRSDKRAGSLKANLNTGKWGDFATGDRGGDLISLAAYVAGLPQREAAIRLADSLGVSPWE